MFLGEAEPETETNHESSRDGTQVIQVDHFESPCCRQDTFHRQKRGYYCIKHSITKIVLVRE